MCAKKKKIEVQHTRCCWINVPEGKIWKVQEIHRYNPKTLRCINVQIWMTPEPNASEHPAADTPQCFQCSRNVVSLCLQWLNSCSCVNSCESGSAREHLRSWWRTHHCAAAVRGARADQPDVAQTRTHRSLLPALCVWRWITIKRVYCWGKRRKKPNMNEQQVILTQLEMHSPKNQFHSFRRAKESVFLQGH